MDAHVGQHLFERCIMNLQRRNKCIILVTNALQFLKSCTKIIVLRDGQVVESGGYEELLNTGYWLNEMITAHLDSSNSTSASRDNLNNIDIENIDNINGMNIESSNQSLNSINDNHSNNNLSDLNKNNSIINGTDILDDIDNKLDSVLSTNNNNTYIDTNNHDNNNIKINKKLKLNTQSKSLSKNELELAFDTNSMTKQMSLTEVDDPKINKNGNKIGSKVPTTIALTASGKLLTIEEKEVGDVSMKVPHLCT